MLAVASRAAEPLDGLGAVCRFVVTISVEVVAREGGEQHEAIIRQGSTSARAESSAVARTDWSETLKRRPPDLSSCS